MSEERERPFRKYWSNVSVKAWRDTIAFLFPSVRGAILAVAAFGIAVPIFEHFAGAIPAGEQMNWGLATVITFAIIFVPIFLFNFAAAPHRLDADKQATIDKLQRELSRVGVQLKVLFVSAQLGKLAKGASPYVTLTAQVIFQFHNCAAQPLSVRKLRLDVLDRQRSVVIGKRESDVPIRMSSYKSERWLPFEFREGIYVPAGKLSELYRWSLSIVLPADVELSDHHVLNVAMDAMNQREATEAIAINWEEAREGGFVYGSVPINL
jgi:hypothetical protein